MVLALYLLLVITSRGARFKKLMCGFPEFRIPGQTDRPNALVIHESILDNVSQPKSFLLFSLNIFIFVFSSHIFLFYY